MDGSNAGGIDVYVQAHDAAYHASMRRLVQTTRAAGAQMQQALTMSNLGSGLAAFGQRADVVFTGLGNRMRLLARDLRNFSGTLATVSGFGAYISGRAFIETAGQFEQQMEITRSLSGATERQMAGLERQTVQLGSSTARTANEIAAGALELQKMGRSISDIQLILPAVTNFAIAADQPVAGAAHTAGAVMMQFRMQATETNRVMDTLMRGANRSAADVNDFAIALTYAGQQAFNANVSLERTVAMMQTASDAGIPGSRLGTGLQSVLNDIYMPNLRQAATFQRFGIVTRETTGELRDLYAILDDIFTKMPMSQWGRFEVDTQNYLMALRGQGIPAIQAREQDLGLNSAGEAARTAEARMRGLRGALDALGGAFDALMIKAGEAGLTRVLTNLFKDLGEWVASLSQASTNTLMLAGAFTAVLLALNPIMFLLGSMLTVLTSPEGLIFAFVALAASAAVWSHIEAELAGVKSALDATADSTQRIASLNQQLATAAGEAADELRRQRLELTATLRVQSQQAEAQARAAEAAADSHRRSAGHSILWGTGIFGDLGEAMEGAVGQSDRDIATAARARADTFSQAYEDAVNGNMDRDFRDGAAHGLPPLAPPVMGNPNAMLGMSAAASIERQTRLLEAQAAAARESLTAMQRLAAIQGIIEQSRDGMGGQMGLGAATAIYERQRAAQGVIANAQQQEEARTAAQNVGKALARTRVEIAAQAAEQRVLTQAMEGGERAYERTNTALGLLRDNYGMTREEADRLAAGIQVSNENFAQAQERMQRFAQAGRDAGQAIAGAFERAAIQGESLSGTLKQLAMDIVMIAVRAAVIQPLGNALGRMISGAIGGMGGAPTGIPGKAVGGSVWPGGAVMVGEQGPEMFVPRAAGSIVTNAALRAGGGGGAQINYAPVYHFQGGASAEDMAKMRQMIANDRAQFTAKVKATVGDLNSRGRGWA